MQWIKRLDPFRKPTVQEIAARDLETAKRELLSHQSQAEYHQSMCAYYRNVANRLAQFLRDGE
jgi:hypothetical protein